LVQRNFGVAVIKRHFSAGGLSQLRYDLKECCLPRTVVADESDAFTSGNAERDSAQGKAHTVSLFHFAKLDFQSAASLHISPDSKMAECKR
jgi:hypothetical protein